MVKLLLQVVGGSLLIALCAQIKIPLPFTPVPISLQTLAVAFVGAILGKKRGTAAGLCYLSETTIGLPFLAGGASNPLALIGPTGGYLIGMAAQAYLVGWYYEQSMGRHFLKDTIYNFFCGLVVIACGAAWLSNYVGIENALWMGVIPFLAGDALKSILVTRMMMSRQRIRL